MAKQSNQQRQLKRLKMIEIYKERRIELKKEIKNKDKTIVERMALQKKLNSLPRDSSIVRSRNRCGITGRTRSFYRRFRLSRIALRELALAGEIPGMIKSSR